MSISLTNERQRELLLQVIDNAPLSGTYVEVKQTVIELEDLRNEIVNAKVTE